MLDYNPFVTALKRTDMSVPMRILKKEGVLQGDILDFGCGYGMDGKLLSDEFTTFNYDKYNLQFKDDSLLQREYDVVSSIYVFNVIASLKEFYDTLETVKRLSGKIFIAVRADIEAVQPTWNYDSENDGYWLKKGSKPSFQRFFNQERVKQYFGDVDILLDNKKTIVFNLKN